MTDESTIDRSKLKEEIESLNKAIRTDPTNCLTRYARASAYQRMGEMEKAADDFRAFLLADNRHAQPGTTPWGFIDGSMKAVKIGMQQAEAQACLTRETFKKILNTYDLPTDYTNKKLYKWKLTYAHPTEDPQDAAYRQGVAHLLQQKNKKAIQHLNQAIEMNPQDARAYFFRGLVHALESSQRGQSIEPTKTKAMNDFDRAIALSKDNALTEQARSRLRAMVDGVSHIRSTPWF